MQTDGGSTVDSLQTLKYFCLHDDATRSSVARVLGGIGNEFLVCYYFFHFARSLMMLQFI